MNAELNQLFESVIEIDIWASNDAEINNLVIGTFIGRRTVNLSDFVSCNHPLSLFSSEARVVSSLIDIAIVAI